MGRKFEIIFKFLMFLNTFSFDREDDKWVSLEHTHCKKLIKAFGEEMADKENDSNNSKSSEALQEEEF
jgi:hypothetical protein